MWVVATLKSFGCYAAVCEQGRRFALWEVHYVVMFYTMLD
jgi:hypothetical protein